MRSVKRFCKNLKELYYRRKNYRKFQASGEMAIVGDLPYSVDNVRKSLLDIGINVESLCYRHKKG
jgi:hypothetical protein